MIEQSWLWLDKRRVDRSRTILKKALHVDASNPVILQRLVEIESEAGRIDEASRYLKRLSSAGDPVRYEAAHETLTAFRAHRRDISQARLLDGNGRYEQALAVWNRLIPGVPRGHLALDILPLRARLGDAQAVAQLQVLADEFAEDPRYAEYKRQSTTVAAVKPVETIEKRDEPEPTTQPKQAEGPVESSPTARSHPIRASRPTRDAREPSEIEPASAQDEVRRIAAKNERYITWVDERDVFDVPDPVKPASSRKDVRVAAVGGRYITWVDEKDMFDIPDPAVFRPAPDVPPSRQPAEWAWQMTRKWLNNPGTPGVSDLNQTVDMLHVERDTHSSRTQFWLENWTMEGGRGQAGAEFGLAGAGTPAWTLAAQGVGFGLAYETAGWRFDFGHTPSSFAIRYPVFGIRRSWTAEDSEVMAELSRRPLSESILSFAGARDPATGVVWGGARATGAKLVYDRDIDAWNVGAKAAFYRIDGKDILDNEKFDLAFKANYRFEPWADARLRIGLQFTHWRYAKNTNYYRYGHAGYYSPQRYYSVDLPLEISGEAGRQSYRVAGGVSYSHKQTRDAAEFPLAGTGATFEGSSGYSSGWYLAATWEYRLTNAWALGVRVSQDNSPYYEPTSMMLYLRHDASGKLRWRATYPRDSYFKE